MKICIYFISGLIPRNKKIWIFGAPSNLFFDNPKYLFIYVTENQKIILPVWISGDEKVVQKIRSVGGVAYRRWSLKGIYYSLIGGVWFIGYQIDDINYILSRGCKLVNLWHGNSLKKIEFDVDTGPLFNLYNKPSFIEKYIIYSPIFRRPDFLISTSKYISEVSFASAFRIDLSQCLQLGYPRLDILYWPRERVKEWLEKWGGCEQLKLIDEIETYSKVLLYMPTWRDADPHFINKIPLNFEELNNLCTYKNILILVKIHPATPQESKNIFKKFRNIKAINSNDDIYPLLSSIDVLITDYSSVFFDYLLVNRPIYFFPFDLSDYVNNSRGLYFKYEEITPGLKINSEINLIELLTKDVEDNYKFQREIVRKKMYDYVDDKSCERIFNHISNLQIN